MKSHPQRSNKKSPKKLTLLDLIDIDQLVNEHAEVVNIEHGNAEKSATLEVHNKIDPIKEEELGNKEFPSEDDEGEEMESEAEEVSNTKKQNRKCSYCRKAFTNNIKLREHVKHCYMKKHKCEKCELKFATESKLDRHVKERHLQIREFACKECDKEFSRKDKLADHVEAVHQKKQKHLCSKCGKGMTNCLQYEFITFLYC